jgi:hypothetical protein
VVGRGPEPSGVHQRGSSTATVLTVIGVLLAAITLLWQLGYIPPRHGPTAILNISPDGGLAGTSVQASGTGFGGNELVIIYIQAMEAARITADDHGGYTASITIPKSLEAVSPFQAQVAAVGQSSKRAAGAAFNVADPCGYQSLADKATAIQNRKYCKPYP